ncbi:putative 2-dehydropantoate 2-reductase [Planctomycetales bacterium ZRK34]|nr:putative 2-dehydropantoate 2-reductase [Planctomycetales bacterium ZRK34]
MSERSIAIIGTGALGGYYGSRLHHAGRMVHFNLHNDFDHVRLHGLCVESPHGDFSIEKPRISQSISDLPPCDVVMVCVKTTTRGLLDEALGGALKDDGVVVVMQNGLNVEAEAAAIVGPDRVIGGMAFLCSNKIGPGHIRHLDYGLIRLGQYSVDNEPRGITSAMRDFAADLEAAGIDTVLEDDLVLARWKKLVWNVPYNGLSVVLDTTTDQLMQTPATRALCEALMGEVVTGAAAFGRTIEPAFVQQMLENTDKMVAYAPSMLLDYRAGRPMEIEAIHGEPVRAAASQGVDLPLMQCLYRQLQFIDSRRS